MAGQALVLVHLDSLASYAWHGGDANALAGRIGDAIRATDGLVVLVVQGWGTHLASLLVRAANSRTDPTVVLQFDEDSGRWPHFLRQLRHLLASHDTGTVRLGGLWYDPTGREGCVTYVASQMQKAGLKVTVDPELVGCMRDIPDLPPESEVPIAHVSGVRPFIRSVP